MIISLTRSIFLCIFFAATPLTLPCPVTLYHSNKARVTISPPVAAFHPRRAVQAPVLVEAIIVVWLVVRLFAEASEAALVRAV
jgi:hypothetical protein